MRSYRNRRQQRNSKKNNRKGGDPLTEMINKAKENVSGLKESGLSNLKETGLSGLSNLKETGLSNLSNLKDQASKLSENKNLIKMLLFK